MYSVYSLLDEKFVGQNQENTSIITIINVLRVGHFNSSADYMVS